MEQQELDRAFEADEIKGTLEAKALHLMTEGQHLVSSSHKIVFAQ